MTYRVLERGLLTDNFTPAHDSAHQNYTLFQEPELSKALKMVDGLKDIATAYGRTTAQVALRWNLDHSEVAIALVGASSKKQLAEALGAVDWSLRSRDMSYLNGLFD
jgi:aryl-alcohol dehydrogenase-like predicted oxidoreductase